MEDAANERIKETLNTFSNLKNEDLIRGTTPINNNEQCLTLCQDYLGDGWLKAKTVEDIEVTRICGGLTNQLYLVKLKLKEANVNPKTPNRVAIRLFEPKHELFIEQDKMNHFSDFILSVTLANLGIAPKVYGVFTEGMMLEYHEHEQFRVKHKNMPDLVRQVAEHLATIHSLEVPLKKPRTDPYINTIRKKILASQQKYDFAKLGKELEFIAFQENDLMKELEELAKIVEKLEIPIVLCHNDFRSSNILVTENNTKTIVCDFDYSAYGPRAYDLGIIFSEWNVDFINDKEKSENEENENDKYNEHILLKKLITNEQKDTFIKHYIAKMKMLVPNFENDPKNSLEAIRHEVDIYSLVCLMFFTVFFLTIDLMIIPGIEHKEHFTVKQADLTFYSYLQLKKKLIDDGVLKI